MAKILLLMSILLNRSGGSVGDEVTRLLPGRQGNWSLFSGRCSDFSLLCNSQVGFKVQPNWLSSRHDGKGKGKDLRLTNPNQLLRVLWYPGLIAGTLCF
jgi:hypothetical protein